jgi:hypothetical protein
VEQKSSKSSHRNGYRSLNVPSFREFIEIELLTLTRAASANNGT